MGFDSISAQGTHRRGQHRNLIGRPEFGVGGGSGFSSDSPACCPYSWWRLPSWTPPGTTLLASTLMGSSPPERLSTYARRVWAFPRFSQVSAHIWWCCTGVSGPLSTGIASCQGVSPSTFSVTGRWGLKAWGRVLRKVANCSVLLPSECVVDKEMSPKEAFPIALCSVMNLAGVLGKGVTLVPVIRGLPAGSGGEPKSHTPEPCLPPSHCTWPPSSLPRAGLIGQGECCSYSEQERRWQPAAHRCWGCLGSTEC